ncbi:MAG: type II secretion system protein GspG [Verrucomicrobia bacterium]|nr:MAG: type II secretion system protein GspG [Verrucomicrobiota bacterium]
MSRNKPKGFTLLEIMIVVAIIGILVSLGIYKTVGHLETAREMRVQSDLQTIKTQLTLYESRNGFYPTTDQGVKALVTEPTTYRCPGTRHPDKYDVFSAGKDRTPDTADDIWPQQ